MADISWNRTVYIGRGLLWLISVGTGLLKVVVGVPFGFVRCYFLFDYSLSYCFFFTECGIALKVAVLLRECGIAV